MQLTRAGELLLGHAETIMSRLRRGPDRPRLARTYDCGNPIRIGAYQSVARTMLPLVLQELGVDSEEVDFSLKESNDDAVLLDLLERGELDVSFVELPIPDGPLEATRLLDDPFVLVAPDEHDLAMLDRPITLEELAEVPLIPFKCRSTARVRDTFALHGLSTTRRPRGGGRRHAVGLVHAGLGLGLMPRLAADIEGKPLVAIPVEPRLAPRIVAIAWHTDRLRTCSAGLFIDLAVDVAAQLDAGPVTARDWT